MLSTTMPQISDEDRQRIDQAVQQAEALAAVEIVPVIAGSSGRYDRSEDICGLWTGLVAMAVAWTLYPLPQVDSGEWGGVSPWWHLVVLIAAMVVGFLVGAILAARIALLRRLFTPSAEQAEEVDRRARAMFFDARVHHTTGASGILLYVSLLEHRAAIIADQTVLNVLGQEPLDALCEKFTTLLHSGTPTEALCDTIAQLGERLAKDLPRTESYVDQLPNALVVLE
ncbi:MAG: hypothetical protein WDZ51_18915 [Pirellulaceae bacterium]